MRRSKALFANRSKGNRRGAEVLSTNRTPRRVGEPSRRRTLRRRRSDRDAAAAATIALQTIRHRTSDQDSPRSTHIDAELVPTTPSSMQDKEPVPATSPRTAAHRRPSERRGDSARGEWGATPAPRHVPVAKHRRDGHRPEQTFLNIQAAVRHWKSELITVMDRGVGVGLFPAYILVVCATGDLAEQVLRARDILHQVHFREKHVRQDELATSGRCPSNRSGPRRRRRRHDHRYGVRPDHRRRPDQRSEEAGEAMKANPSSGIRRRSRTASHPGGTLCSMAWTGDDLRRRSSNLRGMNGDRGASSNSRPRQKNHGRRPRNVDRRLGRSDGDPVVAGDVAEGDIGTDSGTRSPTSRRGGRSTSRTRGRNVGNMFPRDRWVVIGDEPTTSCSVRGWDLAGSSNKVTGRSVLLGRTASRRTVVLDVRRHVLTVGCGGTHRRRPRMTDRRCRSAWNSRRGDANVTLHHWPTPRRLRFKGTPSSGTRLLAPNCSRQRWEPDSCRSWTGSGPTGTSTNFASFPAAGNDDQVDASTVAFGARVGPDGG